MLSLCFFLSLFACTHIHTHIYIYVYMSIKIIFYLHYDVFILCFFYSDSIEFAMFLTARNIYVVFSTECNNIHNNNKIYICKYFML